MTQLLDLLQILFGTSLGLFVILLPGYGLGWTLDLFQFRTRSWLGKLCLSSPIAIALLPILVYLPYRFLSVRFALALVLALAALGLLALLQNKAPREVPSKHVAAVLCVWVMVAAFCLIDFDTDGRVYNSSLAWDHSVRVQTVTTISHAERLPLESYFFHPGRSIPFRYYYFAYFFPSFIQRLGLGALTAKTAFSAFIIWVGVALLGIVAAYIYFFIGRRDRRAVIASWLLLGVGGLQVIPFLCLAINRAIHGRADVIPLPSLTFWNNISQVTGWLDSLLWVPNHISSLIALLLGCLILWEAREAEGRARWMASICAGMAFASGVGLSIYVCLVFAIFLAVVTVYLFAHSHRQTAVLVLIAGIISAVLALPFLLELIGGKAPSPLALWVREFEVVTLILGGRNVSPWLTNLLHVLTLPLNYFIELGLYFLVAWWWIRDRVRSRIFSAQDKLMLFMLLLAFVLCSFVRSYPTNDLAWRGLLPAQFVLVLFAADLFVKRSEESLSHGWRWRLATICVVIGIATNVSEILVLRSYEPLADAGLAQRTFMLTPTLATGLRNAQLRAAYDWVRVNTDAASIVQQNPIVTEETALGLYAERRTSVYGRHYIIYPSDKEYAEFENALLTISMIYQPGVTGENARELCSRAKLDYVVAQDLDPVWRDPASFVWTQRPVFQAPLVRVFDCRFLSAP